MAEAEKELVKSEIQVVEAFRYDEQACEKTAEQVIKHRNGNMRAAQAIIVVKDKTSSTLANQVMKRLAAIVDAFEFCRKKQTSPALEYKKMCDTFWNMLKNPVQTQIDRLKGLVREYRLELDRKEAEEARKIAAEEARRRKIQEYHKEQGHQVNAPVVLEKPKVSELKQDVTRARKLWKYKVVDEDLVPRDYLRVDTSSIYHAIQEGVRDIPGVEIYQEESIVVR